MESLHNHRYRENKITRSFSLLLYTTTPVKMKHASYTSSPELLLIIKCGDRLYIINVDNAVKIAMWRSWIDDTRLET